METELDKFGFKIIESVYSDSEIDYILKLIESKNLKYEFGVRNFLISYPTIAQSVFTSRLLAIVKQISPNCKLSIKSIYFNKPPRANWVVNWHQDLTINLQEKKDTPEFKNWRILPDRISVQPSNTILENIFTIRLHLDNCNEENGALQVIEGSHKNGIIPIKKWIPHKPGTKRVCSVKKGGILLMKPLLLHASRRTENHKNRRVIHIEFCDYPLPDGLHWKEKINLNQFYTP